MKLDDQYIFIHIPKPRVPKVLKKVIPIWLVLFLLINTSLVTGVFEYYIIKRNININLIALAKTTKSPEELAQILKQEVIPQSGYTLAVQWNDIGQQLLDSGIIDKIKFNSLFQNDPQKGQYLPYLDKITSDHMVINEINSQFMVDTLWGFGLVNKSKVLEEGVIATADNGNHMNFASTGGWNLGTKLTSELYSSVNILTLTPEQEDLVNKIARNIYRPCCNNPTSFPDCNHGMAALGYIELAVKQGIPEKRIYKDILALNSFWFPQTYVTMAAYFQKQGTAWKDIDAKTALSAEYSSATGAQKLNQAVQTLPGTGSKGGGCSA
jgi:hypothetical protein